MTLAPTETQFPSVLVVIVNYRTSQLTIDCLQSLQDEVEKFPSIKVVVVDNLSGDDSVAQIQSAIADKNWQTWVSLVPADKNGGYSYGNNVAIRPALASENPPDYIWLLNPDTLVLDNTIKPLLKFMGEHPTVGIVGSSQDNEDGILQRSAFRFPTCWSELDSGFRLGLISRILANYIVAPVPSEIACQTDWVSGGSMMIRREVFEKIGLLDEEYFLYFEEVDFCLQAKRSGWECWYVPESKIIHFAGQSSGVTDPKIKPKRRPQYWFDSRQRFFLKNYGRLYTIMADLLWIIGFSVWSIRRVIQGKVNTDPPYFFKDFVLNTILFAPFFKAILKTKTQ
jgi:GT2 family glycosyltransferase